MNGSLIIPATGDRFSAYSVWIYDLDRPREPTSADPRRRYEAVRCEGTYSNRQAAERAAGRFMPIKSVVNLLTHADPPRARGHESPLEGGSPAA